VDRQLSLSRGSPEDRHTLLARQLLTAGKEKGGRRSDDLGLVLVVVHRDEHLWERRVERDRIDVKVRSMVQAVSQLSDTRLDEGADETGVHQPS